MPEPLQVTAAEAGQKLLQFLSRRFEEPQSVLHRWIDLGMVFHHATHVICLKRHVFAEGTPDEVLTQENLMALFGMHMGLINPHAPTADQPKDHHA